MTVFGEKVIARIIISGILLATGLLLPESDLLTILIFGISCIVIGYPVFLEAAKDIINRQPFNENFLMTVAAIGAFAITEYPEGVAILLFYQVGTLFEDYAVDKSRRSISSLLELMPDYANLITDEGIVMTSPENINVGDHIIIRPGELVPLDGIITEGRSMIDTSSVTGESTPRNASKGDMLLSGCMVVNGALTVEVTSKYEDSTASKIVNMVEEAYGAKSRSENFVTIFAKYYTPFVVVSALLLAVIPPLILGSSFDEWIYRALTFLVISCPCALVISIPLAFFGGIGGASRVGILVKGGNYLEALAKIDTVVFDKTGTLTEGTFDVENIHAVGMDETELLKLVAHAEFHSNHPIAKSILNFYQGDIESSLIGDIEEIAGAGIRSSIDGKTVLVGNVKLMSEFNIAYELPSMFGTIIHTAVDGKYSGYFVISDRIRTDSKKAVSDLKKMGIKEICMLTGDHEHVGKHVANTLNMDRVFTDLLPSDKITIVEKLLSEGRKIAFVGDGINDAPSLARSDVGIAMGAMGSDAAIEAADIVIMDDMPSKVPMAIRIAKKTRSIAIENIIFALGIKALFLLLGAFGYITLVEAVFADVGVATIAILNSIRTLKTSQYEKN